VGGTTTPTPAGSDFTATLTSTISNLTASAVLMVKALYNSTTAAANQGVFALGSGSVNANSVSFTTVPFFGPILTLATGNQNGTLTLSGGTSFTFNGGGSSTFTPNGTNATVIYSAGGQTINGAIYQNLTLANSGPKTISGVTVNGILSMQGTATATAAPVYGPNATLQYAGSNPQVSGPELVSTIANLSINNSMGVTLTNSTTVSNLLTLANGIITCTNRLILGTNGSISGGTSNSYLNGSLQKNFSVGTQSFLFPVGDTEFAPVNLSGLTVTTAGAVTVSTAAGAPAQIGGSGIATNQDVNRFWIITNSSGGFGGYNATFNYPAADVDAGAVPAQFGVSDWNGAVWAPAMVSDTPTTNSISIAGQSGFGAFVVGDPNPLSIVWSGGGGANQAWSNGSNWLAGLSPRPIDNVFFYDTGAVSTVSNVNNAVDAGFGGTVNSILYGNTNNYHTTLISSGLTLNCLSNFTVGTETYTTPTQTVVATITGPGGTLNLTVTTNTTWNVRQGVASGTNAPGTPGAKLDMSGLGTFTTLCRGMAVGVESAALRRAAGTVYLAKTNVIYAAGVPTAGTTYSGNPGIYIGHNTQSSNQSPSGSALYLGITNAIFSDYIVVGRGNQTNNLMAFNPAFLSNNPVAYFRSFDGASPVDVWTVGDNSPSGNITSPSSGTNDFTGGRLDALVETMFVGRGALSNQTNAASPGIGTFTFNNGILNVNTFYIGYQNLGTNLYSSGIGTVNVNSTNATLIVSNLDLAYATNTSVVSPSGTLNVSGGTVVANNIVAAGGTASLRLSNATLVVSNIMGTTTNPLTTVGVTNSTLQFSVMGSSTNAVVSSLTTGGATNRINIVSLPTITSYPVQFTLIKYSGSIGGAGFNFGLNSLPAANPAYQGYVSNNAAGSAVLLVLTPPAVNLAVTSINGGTEPQVGSSFSVTVQSQDSGGTPRNLPTDTGITLSLNAGNGVLGGTLTGTISAGTSSVTINGVTYSTAQSGVQIAAATTSGQNLSNAVSAAFAVNPGNQAVTFPSPGNQTYGVAPINLAATASSGLPVGYSITSGPGSVSSNMLTITGAGSVTIQASQSGNANWNAASPVSQTISVAQKFVTGSFITSNKTYNGTTTATIASLSLSGVINSDVVNLTVGTVAFTDPNVGSGKTVIASGLGLGGANAGNYAITSSSATNTATITAATLTVTANNTNRAFGAANPVFTVSYSGFVNGETTNVLSGNPALSTSADTNSPPGAYPIQVGVGSLSAANYNFTLDNGTLTVTSLPAILTLQLVQGETNVVVLSTAGLTPGDTYQILGSTDFVHWAQIGTAQSAADGTLSYTNPVVSPSEFFRTLGP
jgi:hypothetical protein